MSTGTPKQTIQLVMRTRAHKVMEERDCFRTSCKTVHDGEKMSNSSGLRKWSYDILVDVVEALVWQCEALKLCFGV